MAQAKSDPTRIDDPSKTEPSPWLSIVDDLFGRWRPRLESNRETIGELEALLSHPETRSAYVSASGELWILDGEFWRNTAHLEVVPDADGVGDRLEVRRPTYVNGDGPFSDSPGGTFLVLRTNAERWERLYFPMTAAPLPRAAKGPVRGEIDRYGDADRALFPEIERLMKSKRLTRTEAVRQIPEAKLAGHGTLDSRIRRVSDRFRREKL
jgi:hypothetical protein